MADVKRTGRRSLAAVVGAACATACITFTSSHEGVSLKPYDDRLAGNVQTVCFGETQVEMHLYALTECKQMLDGSLAGYADAVRTSTPGFDSLTQGQKVAAIDLAYNAGLANYRGSTLRRRYIARDFPGACNEYLKWRFAGGRDCAIASSGCSGIYRRRVAERAACLGE
ncbi:lysozyme [Paraburkholderia sp. BL6665CI2N2]|uniref:glycoside hydrolase family protein n=1 Tax=Paraburkholderia sp. BL6665CI2N2 TaxID=1938806 RepID=UPI001064C677|nr:glycoside hydrolase family protein [Paraburkholderia sp. BL6665CI2N2]TDY26312.1 lysozyme [Paraburkholderia sp. BL6665CI2N2]